MPSNSSYRINTMNYLQYVLLKKSFLFVTWIYFNFKKPYFAASP